MKHILHATDGAADAVRATDFAGALVKAFEASLTGYLAVPSIFCTVRSR
jgi:hypothetical protein